MWGMDISGTGVGFYLPDFIILPKRSKENCGKSTESVVSCSHWWHLPVWGCIVALTFKEPWNGFQMPDVAHTWETECTEMLGAWLRDARLCGWRVGCMLGGDFKYTKLSLLYLEIAFWNRFGCVYLWWGTNVCICFYVSRGGGDWDIVGSNGHYSQYSWDFEMWRRLY